MKASYNNNYIKIIGECFPIKHNRFYLSEPEFNILIHKHKTDLDKFIESKIEYDRFEIKIIHVDSNKFILEAYNKKGSFIWRSQEMKNTYNYVLNAIVGVSVLIGAVCLIVYKLNQ